MLNTFKIGGNTTNVSFTNPSTGIIQKSHPKSTFVRCQKGSSMEDWLFDDNPCLKRKKSGYYEKYADVTVLQIMVFGDNQLLIEIVNNDFLVEPLTPTH